MFKVVMTLLEGQIGAHKSQLKQRTDSIERVHAAIDSLEEKIHAVERMQGKLIVQKNILMTLENDLKSLLDTELATMKVAGTIVA